MDGQKMQSEGHSPPRPPSEMVLRDRWLQGRTLMLRRAYPDMNERDLLWLALDQWAALEAEHAAFARERAVLSKLEARP